MNEQLLKASGTDVLSSRKKLRKTLRLIGGGGGGIHPPLYVRGLKFVTINNNVNYDVDDDDDDHDDDDDGGGEKRSHQNPQRGSEAASTVNQGLNV